MIEVRIDKEILEVEWICTFVRGNRKSLKTVRNKEEKLDEIIVLVGEKSLIDVVKKVVC